MNRTRVISLILITLFGLVGCGVNYPNAVPTQIITPVPTNTLVPILSMTPKYTATLIPTSTLIPSITPPPSETVPPVPPTARPTLSPTPSVTGAVNQAANLRSGPGVTFKSIKGLTVGTLVTVLGADDGRSWYNIRLDDGTEGWLLSNLVTVQNPTMVAVISTAEMTRRAQTPTDQSPATAPASGTNGTNSTIAPIAATPRKPFTTARTDVLAYCDSKTNGEPRKTLPSGTQVSIYWSWFAKTAEQLQDHIDQSQYEVRVDGQLLSNWNDYRTSVGKSSQDGNFYVFWYVPIGAPDPGEHKVAFKVTWKQQIFDGFKHFGPGGDVESDTGTCTFTISK